MGGGAVPYSPSISPFLSNFSNENSDFFIDSENMPIGYSYRTTFGHVPSQMEVQNAINDLKRVMNGYGAIMKECNYDDSRRVMNSLGQKRFLDAYHLLQTDPLVQRLVLSISSDTQVWNAILKNDAIQDLQGSLPLAATEECIAYKQEPNSASTIFKWIFAVMKTKIMELIDKLEVFVFEALHSVSKKTTSTSNHDDVLEEKVRSSLLLSIVILVIVVVTRSIDT